MSNQNKKTWIIVLGVGLIALTLLAASLPQFHFDPDQSLKINLRLNKLPLLSTGSGGSGLLGEAVGYFYIALWIMLGISMVYLLLSPEARKRFLRDLLRTLPAIILLLVLMNLIQKNAQKGSEVQINIAPGAQEAYPMAATPEPTFDANPGSTVVLIASLAVAIVLIGLVAWAVYVFWRRSHPPVSSLSKIARQAASALDAISAGGDLRSTIIRCYLEMSRALSEEHNIHREIHMTPREFESQLAKYALPTTSVHMLTRLFEDARYSPLPLGQTEEHQAITSLTEILEACRSLQ